ncbi:MAG TPA: hypothetical protein VK901_21750 [Nitrospiraceae bacterium]|nr:hypothetical protein [Nitrospiraceae bacterium]
MTQPTRAGVRTITLTGTACSSSRSKLKPSGIGNFLRVRLEGKPTTQTKASSLAIPLPDLKN